MGCRIELTMTRTEVFMKEEWSTSTEIYQVSLFFSQSIYNNIVWVFVFLLLLLLPPPIRKFTFLWMKVNQNFAHRSSLIPHFLSWLCVLGVLMVALGWIEEKILLPFSSKTIKMLITSSSFSVNPCKTCCTASLNCPPLSSCFERSNRFACMQKLILTGLISNVPERIIVD